VCGVEGDTGRGLARLSVDCTALGAVVCVAAACCYAFAVVVEFAGEGAVYEAFPKTWSSTSSSRKSLKEPAIDHSE